MAKACALVMVMPLLAGAEPAALRPEDGCGLPQWESAWSMAGSLYTYCIGQCAR